MRNITVISHYDDDNLKFNENTGRYELTTQYIKENFGPAYANDKVLAQRIKLNSQVVYNYINLHVATVNKPVVNFLLSRTEQGRQFILDLSSAQQYADTQTGYNDLMFQPAINFNGQDKDRLAIRQNALCVAAEQVLEESDNYFGVRITYQAQFPWPFFAFIRNYN